MPGKVGPNWELAAEWQIHRPQRQRDEKYRSGQKKCAASDMAPRKVQKYSDCHHRNQRRNVGPATKSGQRRHRSGNCKNDDDAGSTDQYRGSCKAPQRNQV